MTERGLGVAGLAGELQRLAQGGAVADMVGEDQDEPGVERGGGVGIQAASRSKVKG